jgi:plastocyanin
VERTAHQRVQALGMTMLSLMAITLVVLSIFVFGGGDELGPLPYVVIGLVAATVAVWRWDNHWVRIIGTLVALVVAGSTFWMGFGLTVPFSPLEFIMGSLWLAGFVMAVVWGGMAIVAGFRGRSGDTRTDRAVAVWLPAIVGVAAVVSIVGFFVTRGSVSAEEAMGAVAVGITDFEFDPGEVTVTDGRVLITNFDPAAHDFTIEALDAYAYVGPGSEVIVDLGSAAPGTYDFVCSLHFDPSTGEGMTGRLTISG